MEKFKIAVRWIAVLPGAVLGFFISYALIKLFNLLSNWFAEVSPDSPFASFTDNVILAGFAGFIFVYFGCKIAPNHKKIVAYCLTGLIILFCGMGLSIAISDGIFWNIVGDIFPGVGAIIALYQINSGELKTDGDVFDFNS